MADWNYDTIEQLCKELVNQAKKSDDRKANAIAALTLINDRRFPTGDKKRSSLLRIVRDSLTSIFDESPALNASASSMYRSIDWDTRSTLRGPRNDEKILLSVTGYVTPGL